MIAILKNNFWRLSDQPARVISAILMIAGAVIAAVIMSGFPDIKGHVAYVTNLETSDITSPYLKVVMVQEKPVLSDLVSDRFDAIVTKDAQGTYQVETIKSDDYRNLISTLLNDSQNAQLGQYAKRGTGSTVIGYLMMFILLQGVAAMFLFADDKAHDQIRRIAVSPISFATYLLAHCVFNFAWTFVPTMTVLWFARLIVGHTIGFSLGTYAAMIGLLSLTATGFGIFIHAVFHDGEGANMIGSSLATLTTILAGSFYAFDQGNAILNAIIRLLPQKALLTFVADIERRSTPSDWLPALIQVVAFILVFYVFAVIKTTKKYMNAR